MDDGAAQLSLVDSHSLAQTRGRPDGVGALLAPRPRGAALGAAPAALCPAPGRRMHGGHGARWRERNATMRPGRAERARWTPTEKRLTRAGHCCDRSRPTLWLLYFPRRLLLLQVTWLPWRDRRCSASENQKRAATDNCLDNCTPTFAQARPQGRRAPWSLLHAAPGDGYLSDDGGDGGRGRGPRRLHRCAPVTAAQCHVAAHRLPGASPCA